MTRQVTAIVERDGIGYVALCPEVDVASQGESVAQARSNLEEALASPRGKAAAENRTDSYRFATELVPRRCPEDLVLDAANTVACHNLIEEQAWTIPSSPCGRSCMTHASAKTPYFRVGRPFSVCWRSHFSAAARVVRLPSWTKRTPSPHFSKR